MIAYKFLAAGGRATISGRQWPPPAAAAYGAWIETAGPLDPCRNGVHASEALDLPYWISTELWEVELEGELIRGPQSIVARRGRLVRRIEAWNTTNAREFAAQCQSRAEAYVAALPVELLDRGKEYLATASASLDIGNYAVTAFAAAMAFTLRAASAAAAFAAERKQQGALLIRILSL